MTIPTIIYSDYYPTQLKVDNLAIRVSEDTLSTLQLGNDARVIIGESITSNAGNVEKYYGLIVDDQGLGVNTTIQRRNQMNGQALYIDGDVYITGKIQASNFYPLHDTAYDHLKVGDGDYLDFDGTTLLSGDLKATGLLGGGAGFWLMSDNSNNNVYYPGRATIGNRAVANANRHSLNISKYADRDIDQSQIGITNQQNSQLRLGILGNGQDGITAPAIINTNPGTRLEIHVGRDQDYFQEMYHYSNVLGQKIDVTTGQLVPEFTIEDLSAPDFTKYPGAYNANLAPHFQIDEEGNVGIHTSQNRFITYTHRTIDTTKPENVVYPIITERAALHVEGTLYANDVVVQDPETNSTKNIDELYVRKIGTTFDASQIKPGAFAPGDYTFLSNVYFKQNIVVDKNTHTDTLLVDDVATVNHLTANDTVVFRDASFCNDVYIRSDMLINQSLKVRSGIYAPVYNSNDGTMGWQALQFQVASAGLCNINYLGMGFTTPGKFGCGINPYLDDVYGQFTVVKRDPDDANFEISIYDKSKTNYIKGAFIGHPQLNDDMGVDGSLVIATPQPTDQNFIFNNDSVPQNIYFFPGTDMTSDAGPVVNRSLPPTFGIFDSHKIGVNTYNPLATCDIRGSLMFSDKLIYNDLNNNQQIEIGLWKTQRHITTTTDVVVVGTSNFNQLFSVVAGTSNITSNLIVNYTSNYPDTSNIVIGVSNLTSNIPVVVGTSNIMGSVSFVGTDGITSNQPVILSTVNITSNMTVIIGTSNITSNVPIIATSNMTSNYDLVLYTCNIMSNINSNMSVPILSNVVTNTIGDVIGIQYYNPDAPRVAINTSINPAYALNVAGRVRATQGYYTYDDKLAVMWMDGDDSETTDNFVAPTAGYNMFTWGNVGVGVTQTTASMELKNNYGSETSIRLTRGDNNYTTSSIEFAGGTSRANSWFIKGDTYNNRMEFGRDPTTFLSDVGIRPMWLRYDAINARHQMFVRTDMNVINTIKATGWDPSAALTVGGSMNVFGDINVSGSYKINGVIQTFNSNVPDTSTLGLSDDDVFIGGRHIVLNPDSGKTVMIGVPPVDNAIDSGTDKDSLLRLYQPSAAPANSVICSMRSAGSTALISLIAERSRDPIDPRPKELKFGVFNPADNSGNAFKFVDENDLPYISFQTNASSLYSERYVGFNTDVPSAMIHVSTQSDGSNMLKLTKVISGADSSDAAPALEIERFSDDTSHKWNIKGPMYAQGRMGFIYDETEVQAKEVFTFTKDGQFGIGNTSPSYALDIMNTDAAGGLRLWCDGVDPTPHIVLQSGDRTFGADELTDYIIYTRSNQYWMQSETVGSDTKTVMNVNDTGRIGIGMPASSNFDVQVVGDLNVMSRIFINGTLLFDAGDASGQAATNFTAKGLNVLLRPDPFADGGVVLNGRATDAYGNLFQIYSGNDANMTVWDSKYQDLQLHFRVKERLNTYHMYRMGMSNQKMYWEYHGPDVYSGAVSASHDGYSNVFSWQPSPRISGDFDATLSGSVNLASSSAEVVFGSNGLIGSGSSNMYIVGTCNIGIGTVTPTSNVHIYTSNAAVLLTQAGVGNMLEVRSGAGKMVVDNNGNIGIGTAPRTALDVASGQIYTANGSAARPAYSFAASVLTGVFSPAIGNWSVATNGTERMRIDDTGRMIVGGYMNVTAATTTPLVTLTQTGGGDVLQVTNSNGASVMTCKNDGSIVCGSILPASNAVYDLGSCNYRWRDLYLSGQSLDIDGTRLTRTSNGDLQVSSNIIITNNITSELKNIIVKELNLNNKLLITSSPSNTPVFATLNNAGAVVSTFTPVIADNASSSISVGTNAKDATMHLVTASNVALPSFIIDQYCTSNVVDFRSMDNTRFLIDYKGNVGIGTALPSRGLLDIAASNATSGIYVGQTGVGNVATFSGSNGASVVVDRYGNVGIHTTPQVALDVVGQQRFDGWATFTSNVQMNANLIVTGNTITHGDAVTDSDRRLKTDLVRIEDALDKVNKLTGYTFLRINDAKRSTGLVAQDVMEVLPEAVEKVTAVHYGVTYGNMVGLIVEAIKELHDEVKTIKNHLKI